MRIAAIFLIALTLLAAPARAALITKEVLYKDGDTELSGYFAYDDWQDLSTLPGVIVVHEWWGHNDYARHRAEQLAKLGYAAFAVDMYGKGVLAKTPREATALSKPFYDNRALMRRRAEAGIAELKLLRQGDGPVSAVGYCFGGTVVLELARAGEPLAGVVSLHGGLSTPVPAAPDSMKNERVLALNGGADKTVPPGDRTAFAAEMQAAGAHLKMIEYPGALHAFTNPASTEIGRTFNLPVAYDAQADKKSFVEMRDFLARSPE